MRCLCARWVEGLERLKVEVGGMKVLITRGGTHARDPIVVESQQGTTSLTRLICHSTAAIDSAPLACTRCCAFDLDLASSTQFYQLVALCYISLESIGFTSHIFTFPRCVFLSFSTSMFTVTLSNTAISTSSPPGPEDAIVKV
jgi:hypothetical protein